MLPITIVIISKIGARTASLIFGVLLILSLLPMALSPNWWFLSFALIFAGGAGGGFNLSINSLGSGLESRMGMPKMSTIHSWFGVGTLAGAILGTAAASIAITPLIHFAGISTTMAGVLIVAFRYIPNIMSNTIVAKHTIYKPKPAILWLGVMIFLAATAEASIMNWVALFFSDFLQASESIAPIGYATYAAALLLMRFIGDGLRINFGARNLLTFGSLFAVMGVFIAIYTPGLVFPGIGIFMMGAGVALTFPIIFSVVGKDGASALATVILFGSVGEMLSQPMMGFVVQQFNLNGGFLFIATAILITSAMAWKSSLLRER
jgi:hypothetical protein